MTGSKLQRLAWLLPLAVAAGFAMKFHALRQAPEVPGASLATSAAEVPPVDVSGNPPLASASPAEREALDRLRKEVDLIRSRIADREREAKQAIKPEPPSLPEIEKEFLAPDQWRDRGAESPAAAVETLLWAGAGGDLARISSLIAFDASGREAAEALWQQLPADQRPANADARSLMALLATDSVPLDHSAKLSGNFMISTGEQRLVLQLEPLSDDPDATAVPLKHQRIIRLTALRDSESGLWNLLLPASAVEEFGQKLGLSSKAEDTPTS